MPRVGIVNVNLKYKIPRNWEGRPEDYLFEVELPKEYVEDSFNIVKIRIEPKEPTMKYIILDEISVKIMEDAQGAGYLFDTEKQAVSFATRNYRSWRVIEIPFNQ